MPHPPRPRSTAPGAPDWYSATEFRRLHERFDHLERHIADLLFLQLSAQALLTGRRRDFSALSRSIMISVLLETPYEGLCPCCGSQPVLDGAGRPLPGAQFDHVFHCGLNKPEHGWLICQPCHRDLTHHGYLNRFSRFGAFRRFQDAVLASRREFLAKRKDNPS